MYKDPRGNYISENSVVLLDRHLYTVIGFDSANNYLNLKNGCIVSQAKPEDVVCVHSYRDVERECGE